MYSRCGVLDEHLIKRRVRIIIIIAITIIIIIIITTLYGRWASTRLVALRPWIRPSSSLIIASYLIATFSPACFDDDDDDDDPDPPFDDVFVKYTAPAKQLYKRRPLKKRKATNEGDGASSIWR